MKEDKEEKECPEKTNISGLNTKLEVKIETKLLKLFENLKMAYIFHLLR